MRKLIEWDSTLYQNEHSYVYKYGEELIGLLNPQANEKILDLGCGTGQLSEKIHSHKCKVLGVDASPVMIEAAKEKFPEIEFRVMDATSIDLHEKFDAVFSNAVMHWINVPEVAAIEISNCLESGGRFVAEFGGKGNIKSLIDALKESFLHFGLESNAAINFWYFPSIAEYGNILEQVGIDLKYAELYARPTELGENGIVNWFNMFGEIFFYGIDDLLKMKVLERTQEILKPTHYKQGKWYADYVRIRILAVKN